MLSSVQGNLNTFSNAQVKSEELLGHLYLNLRKYLHNNAISIVLDSNIVVDTQIRLDDGKVKDLRTAEECFQIRQCEEVR